VTDSPDSLELSTAVRRLLQAGRQMQAALARQLGVRVTDVQAVDHVLLADEPLGPVELGTRLGIRSASATVLVDRLVAVDHLSRDRDPQDGRRVTLSVTDHAREEVGAALLPLAREVTDVVEQLSPSQRRAVLRFLQGVTDAMWGYGQTTERGDGGDG
jgi:DNA-binding MarR family transcriptional regulator